MRVKPAEGRAVRDPTTMRLLPNEGADVRDDDPFWARRLAHGDVVIVVEPPPDSTRGSHAGAERRAATKGE